MATATELIIVAGHAPFQENLTDCPDDPSLDRHWVLDARFQLGEPPFYVEHIRCGLELVTARPNSLLLFSGGITRSATHWTEAHSYTAVARSFPEFRDIDIWPRVNLEAYARDSLENLLFGLCRFHQVAGSMPSSVSVVSWKFKEQRFRFHAETIGWEERFEYVGVANPVDLECAMIGEAKTLDMFKESPLGIDGALCQKRALRSFGNREHGYQSCAELSETVAQVEDLKVVN